MDTSGETVYIVDDDMWVCRALERLLRAAGYNTRCFESGAAFLAGHDPECVGCVILDVAMPGLGGLDLQRILNESEYGRAIIFLTGCQSIPVSVAAMKSGAVTFLTKPVRGCDLVAMVHEAVQVDRASKLKQASGNQLRQRMSSLTPREREVLDYLIEGRLNKQIAGALGTSEQTVKVHRARVMRKMGAKSLVDLVWQVAGTGSTVQRTPTHPNSLPATAKSINAQ